MNLSTARKSRILLIALAVSLPASGDDLLSAAEAMCEKVKSCSMAQINEADMTPELRQMMEPMLESMCEQMRQGVQQVPAGHPLYQPAVACMRSMANLACDAYLDGDSVETAECMQYRKLAGQFDSGA